LFVGVVFLQASGKSEVERLEERLREEEGRAAELSRKLGAASAAAEAKLKAAEMAAEGMQAHLMAQQGALAAELTELTAMQEAREKEAQAELESLKTQLRGAQEEGTERVSAVEAELAEVRATCAAARQEETRGRAMIDKLELENAEGLQRLRQKEEQLSGAQGQVCAFCVRWCDCERETGVCPSCYFCAAAAAAGGGYVFDFVISAVDDDVL